MKFSTTAAKIGVAAGLLGATTGVAFAAGLGPSTHHAKVELTSHSADDAADVNEDVSGPCDEAEHAADPECTTTTTTPKADDVNDDHGTDDPATHDVNDDNGTDDPATHDVNDDNGTDDPATHDVNDDNGTDDNSGPGSVEDDHSGHGGGDDSGTDDSGHGGDDDSGRG